MTSVFIRLAGVGIVLAGLLSSCVSADNSEEAVFENQAVFEGLAFLVPEQDIHPFAFEIDFLENARKADWWPEDADSFTAAFLELGVDQEYATAAFPAATQSFSLHRSGGDFRTVFGYGPEDADYVIKPHGLGSESISIGDFDNDEIESAIGANEFAEYLTDSEHEGYTYFDMGDEPRLTLRSTIHPLGIGGQLFVSESETVAIRTTRSEDMKSALLAGRSGTGVDEDPLLVSLIRSLDSGRYLNASVWGPVSTEQFHQAVSFSQDSDKANAAREIPKLGPYAYIAAGWSDAGPGAVESVSIIHGSSAEAESNAEVLATEIRTGRSLDGVPWIEMLGEPEVSVSDNVLTVTFPDAAGYGIARTILWDFDGLFVIAEQ